MIELRVGDLVRHRHGHIEGVVDSFSRGDGIWVEWPTGDIEWYGSDELIFVGGMPFAFDFSDLFAKARTNLNKWIDALPDGHECYQQAWSPLISDEHKDIWKAQQAGKSDVNWPGGGMSFHNRASPLMTEAQLGQLRALSQVQRAWQTQHNRFSSPRAWMG